MQRICIKYLGEYVCSRCPNIHNQKLNENTLQCKDNTKMQDIIPHIFLSYHKGYIVKQNANTSTTDNVNSIAKQLVDYSKLTSVSLKSLHQKIDDYWNGKGMLLKELWGNFFESFLLNNLLLRKWLQYIGIDSEDEGKKNISEKIWYSNKTNINCLC